MLCRRSSYESVRRLVELAGRRASAGAVAATVFGAWGWRLKGYDRLGSIGRPAAPVLSLWFLRPYLAARAVDAMALAQAPAEPAHLGAAQHAGGHGGLPGHGRLRPGPDARPAPRWPCWPRSSCPRSRAAPPRPSTGSRCSSSPQRAVRLGHVRGHATGWPSKQAANSLAPGFTPSFSWIALVLALLGTAAGCVARAVARPQPPSACGRASCCRERRGAVLAAGADAVAAALDYAQLPAAREPRRAARTTGACILAPDMNRGLIAAIEYFGGFGVDALNNEQSSDCERCSSRRPGTDRPAVSAGWTPVAGRCGPPIRTNHVAVYSARGWRRAEIPVTPADAGPTVNAMHCRVDAPTHAQQTHTTTGCGCGGSGVRRDDTLFRGPGSGRPRVRRLAYARWHPDTGGRQR